jgi:hypothetical protein
MIERMTVDKALQAVKTSDVGLFVAAGVAS